MSDARKLVLPFRKIEDPATVHLRGRSPTVRPTVGRVWYSLKEVLFDPDLTLGKLIDSKALCRAYQQQFNSRHCQQGLAGVLLIDAQHPTSENVEV